MSDGPDDIDLEDAAPEEGPILSPDELDISDDEHVTQLDEGRFVVSPESRTGGSKSSTPDQPEPSSEQPEPDELQSQPTPKPQPQPAPEQTRNEVTREEVHEWLRESFADGGSRYGFDVTGIFDGSVSQRRMASNDVVTIFESLVLWYAQQIDNDTPVEEVLGILLMESNVPVRYPPQSLKKLVKSTGLGPEDTIADLLAAVDEDDGVTL
jgi:hypothetical protein